jgi:hypothetical protein
MAGIQRNVDRNKNTVHVKIICHCFGISFSDLTPAYLLYVLENLLCVLLIGADYNHGRYSVIAINLQAVVGSCCHCVMVGTLLSL